MASIKKLFSIMALNPNVYNWIQLGLILVGTQLDPILVVKTLGLELGFVLVVEMLAVKTDVAQ